MDSGTVEWWRRHGWTIGLLLVAFGFAMSLRTIWQWPIISQYGALYTYAGGSDSYYHSRVMTYIIQTHSNLVWDPMLKYPVGAVNPREPLFDWTNAVLGIAFAPLFGGNAIKAGAWFLDFESPLWAALTVFPLYLIGREISGRRVGLVAALVYPFFAASIDSSTFGYADYLSFYTFFLLVVIYSYLRTLKAVGNRRWVESYRDPKQYVPAVRAFLRTERTAVKWAVFTGVSLGAFALVWQGYTYAIVVISFTVLISMLIERIRRVDSFGLYVAVWIIGLIAFPMAAPYYFVQGVIKLFLELPVILFFGTLLLLLPFLLLRDVPWIFSIPALFVVVGGGVLALKLLSPSLFASAISGNGYFVKTLVYSTVAEAQAPSIDALIVGYGVVTFFLAFAGLALFGYHLLRQRFKRWHIAFVIFAVVSIYLPISAAKFFLVASPAFALLSAEAIHRLLDLGGYPQLRRSVASLTDRAGGLAAFRKSFKARHVLVLVLVVGILLPNIWISIDAGIPSNSKSQAADQINKTIPSWLKLNASAPASNYLGAAGSGLDTSNQYDSAGYNWLATQDTNIPEPQRPALVSWWDYGFQTIDQGQHPSVADNFQNGIDPAGQFLLAQNESLAIGVLATTLLQAEILTSHDKTLPASLNTILADDGVNVTALHRYLDDEAADYTLVVSNPQVYLPVNPSTITDDNAMYLATSHYLASHLTLGGIARVYDNLESYTGWAIRYALTDSRLIAFTGSDTGIFYAPADLTGRVISAEGVPTAFYNVTVLGSDGTTYPLGPLPAGVSAVQYNINWSAPYYNSMIYRIYFGYNGTDVGQTGGIPGLTGAAESDPIEPGWMLQHFEVEYQTAYVCPGQKNVSSGNPCLVATNRPTAIALANKTNGTDDLSAFSYFEGGESILAYYAGVTLDGRVVLPDDQPVSGVRVTVYDGQGIPHMTNVTGANGSFTLVLPPGNDTLKISYGALDLLNQSGASVIATEKLPVSDAVGFDPNAPTLVQSFTVLNSTLDGQVYWNVSGSSGYSPSVDPVVRGAQVDLLNVAGGTSIAATTDASGTFRLTDVAPGSYEVRVRYAGQTYNESDVNVSAGRTVTVSLPLSPGAIEGTVLTSDGTSYPLATVTLASASGGSATDVSNDSGAYAFTGLAPGTYYLTAVGLDPSLSSGRVAVAVGTGATESPVNLTLIVGGTAQVALRAGGLGLPGGSVTFTPMISLASVTTAAPAAIAYAAGNTTFATASSNGVATATLPVGLYSIQATARVGGQLYVATGVINVTGPGSTPTVSLELTPASTVTVAVPGVEASGNATAVVVYGPGGSETIAWAAKNGSAVLRLPDATYSLLVARGSLEDRASLSARLEVVTVAGSTHLVADATPAVTSHFVVGAPGSAGGVVPAANATVVLSVGSSGATVVATSAANGSVGFVVPSTAVGASGGYCLRASAFGFAPASVCGYTSAELADLTSFPLSITPVAVNLEVVGLPAKTTVTVNVTGESVGTVNLSLTGGTSFSFSLPPGLYGVGARAVLDHGQTVYLPSTELSTEIPVGATYSNLTLIVVPQINATGKLTLPAGLALANTTVSLASPLQNLSVNGTTFTKSFRATPTTYTATVGASFDGTQYVNVSQVTLYPNGSVLPRLVLQHPGAFVSLDLTGLGRAIDVDTTVTLLTPSGLAIRLQTIGGSANVTLPPGAYRVYGNGTSLTSGPNGSYFTQWTTAPGANCTAVAPSSTCLVPMIGTVVTVTLTGTLVPAGGGAPVAGTVTFVGPYPATSVTTVAASNGTFSVSVLPGAYYVYAVSTSGSPLAYLGRFVALPTGSLNVTVGLAPAWTDEVRLSVQGPTDVGGGTAAVTLRDVFGTTIPFANVTVGGTLDLQLPTGTYALNATAPATLNGVAGTASAGATVPLLSGNAVTDLALSVPVSSTVAGTITGPSSVTVAAGGTASFEFSVRNTGNVPVTVKPVGAPSAWTFAFTFANVTLAPGGQASGGVEVTVPAGTAVDHAPVSLEFNLLNGTLAGAIAPAPTVNVLAVYGVAGGTTAANPPQVGSDRASLPFYLANTGNAAETVRVELVDAGRLGSYGWAFTWASGSTLVPSGIFNLSAGQNRTVSLNLSAVSSVVLPPGSLTVQGTVLNVTGTRATEIALTVPRVGVGTSPGSLSVTGPSVTSGPPAVPTWFVPLVAFVPAVALIVAVVTYRWWRTRRWTRR